MKIERVWRGKYPIIFSIESSEELESFTDTFYGEIVRGKEVQYASASMNKLNDMLLDEHMDELRENNLL